MTENDKRLIEASIHYTIAECGRLARISTPYRMNARTKMGVGFDSVNGAGYLAFSYRSEIKSKNKGFLSHRMIYYLHHGELPEFIDHIDGDTRNNTLSNLRPCSHAQNLANKRPAVNGSSKFLGVCWCKRRGKWVAQITKDGKVTGLGRFTDEQDAANAYNTAAIEFHGEFANLNVIEGEKD